MEKDKFQEVKRDLLNLLNVSEQHNITKTNRAEIDGLIVLTAAKLVDVAKETGIVETAEVADTETKKSEIPCNGTPRKTTLTLEEMRDCFHTVIDVVLNKIASLERK